MIDLDLMQGYIREANPIPTLDDVDPDELATFVAATDTRRAAAMQARTRHPTIPTIPVTPPPLRRRKVWAFAAAFILVVAAVGVAALVTRGGGEGPVADEPMPAVTVTTPPSTTAAPDPIDVQSLTWSRVPHDEAVFNPNEGGAKMSSVTQGGPGFVAVGTTDPFWSRGDAAVWTSEDGITWSLLPNDQPPLGGAGGQVMEAVTVGGPGLVAVGYEYPEGTPMTSNAVVWISEDGISWSKVTLERGSALHDVTAGGPGLVALGSWEARPGESSEAGPGEAVWTSVDGTTWNRVPVDGPDELCEMGSVTVGGPGLVAVGTCGIEDNLTAAVFTSPDGLTWARVPHDEAVFGEGEPDEMISGWSMDDVAAGETGLVAVGAEFPSEDGAGLRKAVWTSPDGFTWTRVPHDPQNFGGEVYAEASISAVASVGSHLVAVGDAVWTSVDGLTWTREWTPGGRMLSLAQTSHGLIAVGHTPGAVAVWVAAEE